MAVYRDRLNLDVMVVTTYLNILSLQPDHPAALAALAGRYEAQGRYGDLVQILARQAEAAADPAARVALHRRIASLWADKLGKHQNAVASFEKIFEADPTDAETGARLKDLYTKARAWRPLIELLRKELPHSNAAGRRARLSEMARIAGERLNDTREAIALYNQVLAIEARDEGALGGLATLYERERRWPALVEILERQRQNAEGNAQVELALLERRGTLLYERMAASEAAIDVFKRIQALDPKNARAARALREIYAQAGDYTALEALYAEQGAFGELCDQLTSLADRTADMAARTRLLERVAALSQEKLNQPERALKAYERILATDPAQPQGGAGAGAALPGGAEVAAVAGDLRGVARPGGDGRRRGDGRAARALRRGAPDLRAASGIEGARLPVVRARLRGGGPQSGRPHRSRTAGRRGGRVGRAGGPLRGALCRLHRCRGADWLLRRVLRISATRLFKPQDTRRAAEQILAEVGYDEEADGALETVLTQAKAWPELAKLLHARADRAPDAAERVKLLLRIAQIEEERVTDLAAAAATWAAILDVEPTNERARRSLVRVSEARQDWSGVVEALRGDSASRGATAPDASKEEPKEREELLLRIGNLQETRLKDVDGTFASYREVAQANPYSAPAIAGLERLAAAGHPERAAIARMTLPLYERTENAAKLADANEVLLSVADTLGERVDRLERLRALYGGPLADPAKAYRASLALFEIDPSEVANREALLGFAAGAGVTAELSDKLRAAARTTEDRNLRRDLLVVVAELEEKQPGRAPEAEKVYAQILASEPMHAGAFRALGRLYKEGAALAGAAGAARRPPTGGARRARAAGSAGADRRAGRSVARRSGPRARGLREDAGARSVRPARPPRARTALRRPRALDRSRGAARDARRLRLGDRGAGAGVPARRSARRPARQRGRRARSAGRDCRDRAQPRRRPPAAREAAGGPRPAPARRADPGAGLREERRLGAPGRDPRGAARGSAGNGGGRPAGARGRPAREQAAGAGRRAHHLASGAGRRPAQPRRAAGDSNAWPPRWSGSPSWSTSIRSWRSGAMPPTSAGAPICLSRAAQLYAGRLNNRRAAIDAWKLVLNLDQNNLPTAVPAAAALEALYAETNDVANLVKTLQLQARWADGAARKKLLFRIAGLEEKSLGTPRRRWPRCGPSSRPTRRTGPRSMRSIESSRRGPTTASG